MDHPGTPHDEAGNQAEAVPIRVSRPSGVTLLAAGVLIITIINLLRLILSIRDWEFLASWPGVSPLYITLTGLIWTLTGSILLWGLWRAKSWAPRLMQALALTYALYYWLEHVFLVEHPLAGASGIRRALLPINWPFAAGVTLVCLAFTTWVLKRSKVKAYFSQEEAKTSRDQMNGDSV